MATDAVDYPVTLVIERPERQSRLLALPFYIGQLIRYILLLPHLVVLSGLSAILATFVSLWGILFTGRYPRGLFKLQVGLLRWNLGINAYVSVLYDTYPPMDLDQRDDRPLRFDVAYPEHPNRWLNLPFFPIKFILAIPHLVILIFLGIAAGIVIFLATFAILFGGSFPAGLHSFVTGVMRWATRVICYLAGFTDRYPPFALE